MYGRSGTQGSKFSTNALLQKVTSQLRGEKIPERRQLEDDDDDDLDAYFSSISKKTKAPVQPNWDKYGECDISISEHEDVLQPKSSKAAPTPSSKFLKKKPIPTSQSAPVVKSQYSKNPGPGAQGMRGSGAYGASGALGKAAMFSNKYNRPAQVKPQLSDSDMDMDLSMDEDVMADVRSWKHKPGQLSSAPKPATYKSIDSDDSSSMNIGRGGNKFLKKKLLVQQAEPIHTTSANKENLPKTQNEKHQKSPLKRSPRLDLDTDEESLADFIGGLSGSSSTRTIRDQGPLTPKGQGTKTSTSPVLQEIDEDRSEYNMRLNLMDLDDLQPAVILDKPKKSRKQSSERKMSSSSDEDIFMGLQTVDDLLGIDDLSLASEVYTAGVTSDIQTEIDSDVGPLPSGRPTTPLKSILTTPRTPRSPKLTPRGRVRYKLDNIDTRSPSPDVISTAQVSDLTSIIHTEVPSSATEINSARTIITAASIPEDSDPDSFDDYLEDFSSGRSSPDRTSRSGSRYDSGTDRYSDDFTSATDVDDTSKVSRAYSRSSSRDSYSDSFTGTSYSGSSRSRTPSPERKPRKSKQSRTCEVQTGLDMGLMYHWNPSTAGYAMLGPQYGMAFVDPTPIATHVVSPEALEGMTAYSPSVLALNDMLRQQLGLTTQFMEMQKRLHYDLVSSLEPDHHYTTLADTKKFIKKNKKPIITFEQALRQVKAEMNLK